MSFGRYLLHGVTGVDAPEPTRVAETDDIATYATNNKRDGYEWHDLVSRALTMMLEIPRGLQCECIDVYLSVLGRGLYTIGGHDRHFDELVQNVRYLHTLSPGMRWVAECPSALLPLWLSPMKSYLPYKVLAYRGTVQGVCTQLKPISLDWYSEYVAPVSIEHNYYMELIYYRSRGADYRILIDIQIPAEHGYSEQIDDWIAKYPVGLGGPHSVPKPPAPIPGIDICLQQCPFLQGREMTVYAARVVVDTRITVDFPADVLPVIRNYMSESDFALAKYGPAASESDIEYD